MRDERRDQQGGGKKNKKNKKNEVILGVSGGEGTENCYFFAKKC